jgi:hypothetical protein
MMSEQARRPAEMDVVQADLTASRDELIRRFRLGVRRELAMQLSSGHPIYYGGTGAEAGKLFVHLPDGRRFEYRITESGVREMIRELPQ